MMGNAHETRLAGYIFTWIEEHNTTAKWLADRAGVNHTVFTLMKRGSIPRPDTLRKLADAMGVPRRKLFVLAGYVREEELEPDLVQLTNEEGEVLRLYRATPPDLRRVIRATLREAAEQPYAEG